MGFHTKDQALEALGSIAPELDAELGRIAEWWFINGIDFMRGGYVIGVDNHGRAFDAGEKTVVAQSRLLWFFTKLAERIGDTQFYKAADHGAEFILDKFVDVDDGGVFWSVSPDGKPQNLRKQTYGQAFAIYGLAAYAKLSMESSALGVAKDLFVCTEQHLHDRQYQGYIEGADQTWQSLSDPRLSEKDQPSPKSMNTHLHVMEAYSELHDLDRSSIVSEALGNLVDLHVGRIFRSEDAHLRLFWGREWDDHTRAVSFGHDIEASWLLYEAAEKLGDTDRLDEARRVSLALADAVLSDGVGDEGELFNERSLEYGHMDCSRIWWVQIEAMVGHLNAFQLSGRPEHAARFIELWAFIKKHVIDHHGGEWLWHSKLDELGSPYIAGPWKMAYHNGRGLMECADRIRLLSSASAFAAE